jgi:Leucine-rich repeat (LRR) protein
MNLDGLYLERNFLSGTIPDEIGRLQELVKMYIQLNRLQGPIPSSIGNLSKLQYLNMDGLGHTGLNGTIPVELGNLSSVCTLQSPEHEVWCQT